MIAGMPSNKKLTPVVTELFIRGRKLNIYLVFITQSYLAVPETVKLNSTHYVLMKIPNKNVTSTSYIYSFTNSSDIDFQEFLNLYKTLFFFWLLILLLHQIVLQVLERIF